MQVERRQTPETAEFTRYGRDGSRLTVERFGKEPTSMFVAGIHGDEYEIILPLKRILEQRTATKPQLFGSHIRVMEAFPKALHAKSRKSDDADLNRQFGVKHYPDYPQAKLLADCLLEHKSLTTLFSFHEDLEEDRFYFYYQPSRDDTGDLDPTIEKLRGNLISRVESMGIPLYDGIDDIDLGYWVDRGFCAVAADSSHDDTFEMWAIRNELHDHPSMKRAFLFEVPGKLPVAKKELLLQAIMDTFVEPYLAAMA